MATRNYKKENANYKSRPVSKLKKRTARKKARRMAVESWLSKKRGW